MTALTRGRVASVLAAAFLAVATPAAAHLTAYESAAQDLVTATVEPPTDPQASLASCSLTAGDEIVISWTTTDSTWADGYQVWRSTSTDGTYDLAATLTGRDTTSFTDSGLGYSQQFSYVVRTTAARWTSVATVTVSATTRSESCI